MGMGQRCCVWQGAGGAELNVAPPFDLWRDKRGDFRRLALELFNVDKAAMRDWTLAKA